MLEKIEDENELHRRFPNAEAGRRYLELRRWGGIPKCPYCKGREHYKLKSTSQPYYCKKCRKNFSVITNTIFTNTKVSLDNWLKVIWHILRCKNGTYHIDNIVRCIGVTQMTAGYMHMRIMALLADDGDWNNWKNGVNEADASDIQFEDEVQIDELYLGPKKHRASKKRYAMMRKGRGCMDKIPVIGMYETKTGRMKYIIASKNLNKDEMGRAIDRYIPKDVELVSDGSLLYTAAGAKQSKHVVLNHKKRQYGIDGYHSNGVEGSFKHARDKMDAFHKGRVEDHHLHWYIYCFVYLKNLNRQNKDWRKAKRQGKDVPMPLLLDPVRLERRLTYIEALKDSRNPRRGKRSGILREEGAIDFDHKQDSQ